MRDGVSPIALNRPSPLAPVPAVSNQSEPDVEAQARCGAEALLANDLARAGTHLSRAVCLAPRHIDVLGNIAAWLQRRGLEETASRWLRRLLSIDAEDVAALLDLAAFGTSRELGSRVTRRGLSLAPASREGWAQIARL